MSSLRPYQQRASDACMEFFGQKKKQAGVVVAPCGSGKSHLVADVSRRLGEPVVIFQPRKEILEQNLNKLRAAGMHPKIFSASMGRKEVGDVTLATIQSAIKHPSKFTHFNYVIIDECDYVNPKKGGYKSFLAAIGEHKVIGLTATPFRLHIDREGVMFRTITRSRPKVFQKVIDVTQIAELVKNGWWSPLEYFSIGNFDRKHLQLNTTRTDYNEGALKTYYEDIRFKEGIVTVTKRLLEINRTGVLVFTRFIEEAEWVAKQVGGMVVSANTPKTERERIIYLFRSGVIKVVCCCETLAVGFDYPELDTVVLARPTLSLRLYSQMAGRVVRPHPDKKSAMVVDLCANVRTFGKMEDFHFYEEGSLGQLTMRGSRGQLTDIYL